MGLPLFRVLSTLPHGNTPADLQSPEREVRRLLLILLSFLIGGTFWHRTERKEHVHADVPTGADDARQHQNDED